jgi:protein-disulfide isomerase
MNPRRLTLLTIVVAIVVLAAVVVVPRLTSSGTKGTSTASSSTGATLDYAGQPTIGDANAPVTIAMFEDFLCPHCAEFSDQVWPQIKRDYVDTGKAKAVFFYFPVISQTQSPIIGGLGQCVYMQSNSDFWDLEQILMRAQQQLFDTTKAIDIATQYAPGLDKQKLQKCVNDGTGATVVTKDQAMGQAMGVQGTPTIFVNGKMVSNAAWDTVKKAIDGALSSSSGS